MAEIKLRDAAQAGDTAKVRELLEAGADVNEGADTGSALWWAGVNGKTEVARLLIEWGADLSASVSGYTPYKIAKDSSHAETAAVIGSAKQQPRKLPTPTGPVEKWVAMGAASVAFVGVYPGLEKKLTHTFNFETRERIVLSENLRTAAEAVGPSTSFDDLPPRAVEKALEEFVRLGGKTDGTYALYGESGLGKARKTLPRGGQL